MLPRPQGRRGTAPFCLSGRSPGSLQGSVAVRSSKEKRKNTHKTKQNATHTTEPSTSRPKPIHLMFPITIPRSQCFWVSSAGLALPGRGLLSRVEAGFFTLTVMPWGKTTKCSPHRYHLVHLICVCPTDAQHGAGAQVWKPQPMYSPGNDRCTTSRVHPRSLKVVRRGWDGVCPQSRHSGWLW